MPPCFSDETDAGFGRNDCRDFVVPAVWGTFSAALAACCLATAWLWRRDATEARTRSEEAGEAMQEGVGEESGVVAKGVEMGGLI